MISIAFEGLMRVGKTRTIYSLFDTYRNIRIIPELTEEVIAQDKIDKALNYYIENDWNKSNSISKSESSEEIFLIDRYFISTVVYCLSEKKIAKEYDVEKFIDKYYKDIKLPDYWIFILSSPFESWKASINEYEVKSLGNWSDLNFVSRMDKNLQVVIRVLKKRQGPEAVIVIDKEDIFKNNEIDEIFKNKFEYLIY